MDTSLGTGRARRRCWISIIALALSLSCGATAWSQGKKGEVPEKLRDEIVNAVKKFAKSASKAKARPPRTGPYPVRAPRGPASPVDAFSTILMNADTVACSFWMQWIKSALDQASQNVAQDPSPENLELYQKLWGFRSKVIKACAERDKGSSAADPGGESDPDAAAGPEKKPCCQAEFSAWWWAGWSLRSAERELKTAERRAHIAEEWLEQHGSAEREKSLEKDVDDYQTKASKRETPPYLKKIYTDRRKDAETSLDMIKSMREQAKQYRERATWLKSQIPKMRAAEKAAKARYDECIKTCVKKEQNVGLQLGEGEEVAYVATRPTAAGGSSLLFSVSGSISGLVVDEVRTQLDDDVADDASATHLPPGWSLERDGGALVFSGPPVATRLVALAVSLPPGVSLPAEVPLQVLSDGVLVVDDALSVVAMPAVQVATELKNLLRLPQVVSPLETITFAPSDVVRTPLGGLWEIGGQPAEAADWTTALTGGWSSHLEYTVPASWTNGSVPVRYTDPWGEVLVDAATDDTALAQSDPTRPEQPAITGCTPMAFVGASICVCGYFPGSSASHITLNGEPLGAPLSASTFVANFALSPDMPPGQIEVGGESSAGFTYRDAATGEVIRVGGSVDREQLLRGESTPLALWVQGTEDVVELRLTNNTPAIISLQGGDDQIVATSGGADNRVQKSVRGLKAGPFNLVYELTIDNCPCAEEIATPVSDDVQ